MNKDNKQEQKFKVYCSTNINDTVTKEYIDTLISEDEPLILEAIASTNSVDIDGDYMTNECLEDMKKQAIGLSIFLDHNHTIDKIVGSVTDVIETSSDIFKIKFSVLPKYEWYITDLLDNGINLGLSIGASVLDYENTDTGWKINKVKLVEISIVGIPANWDTFGTVKTSKELGEVTAKCFNGACKQVIDNLSLSVVSDVQKDIEDGEESELDNKIIEVSTRIFNEFGVELKKQIISEIVSEYNLDGKKHSPSDDSDNDEEKPTDSSDEDDKEKNLEMEKEEIKELIKEHSVSLDTVKEVVRETLKELNDFEVEVTEETPIVKEEEVDVTKAEEIDASEETEIEKEFEVEEEVDIEKDAEVETESEETEAEVETEKDAEVEIEKDAEVETESDKIDVGVTVETFDMDELRKSIREELKEEVYNDVEADILKRLSMERNPEQSAHKQPDVEKKIEETATKESSMTPRKLAEFLMH